MNFTCTECNDTGSRDKLGTYLDCNACGTAATRRDLNDFVKSLTQRSTYPPHPEDVALAIHQRALAMAPKQEALKGDAQKNPQANTWPTEIYLQAGDIDVESHLSYDAAMRHEVTWASESIDWNDVRYIRADLAAPAAANGALTDEQILIVRDTSSIGAMERLGRMLSPGEERIAFARAILDAAGPDAALAKALTKCVQAIAGVPMSYNSELGEARRVALAALSGAKGN